MSNIIIIANKVTSKGIIHREFLETMIFVSIIHSECRVLLYYVEAVSKADTGLTKIGQRRILKVVLCHQETS